MDNVIRKAIREEISRIIKLREALNLDSDSFEINYLNQSLEYLCKADYHEFHVNPNKRYRCPKTSFNYGE